MIIGLYFALAAVIYLTLLFRVVGLRQSLQVGIGDGGHKTLARAIRAHANFCETVPLALIGIALVEVAAYPGWVVHALGIALIVGRAGHAAGLSRKSGTSIGRAGGMVLTFGVVVTTAVLATLSFAGVYGPAVGNPVPIG